MAKKKQPSQWKFLKLKGKVYRSYKVSDLGDIVEASTMEPIKQRNMQKKCQRNGTDYKCVYLPKIQKASIRVHRIVCETFHGTPKGKRNIVDHIDERKNNNTARNLQWVTASENTSKHFATYRQNHYSSTVVKRVKKMINRGLTNDAIASKTGMGDSNVSAIRLGLIHKAVEPYTAEQLSRGNVY